MRIVVIQNAGAGSVRSPDEVRADLAAAGLDAEVRVVPGRDCEDAAAAAVREGAGAVVAAGGDGTVSAVASALAGTGTPMGILPLGTLNHFARDLGIPGELAAAARVLAEGELRRVDVGEVNGRRFVNNSSVGLYPRVVRRRRRLRAFLGKWLALALGALAVLWRFPRIRLRLRAAGVDAPVVTPFLFVANNRYAPDLRAGGRREALDRGALHVYVARTERRRAFLRVAVRWLAGLGQDEDVAELAAREVSVESRRRHLDVAADGEVVRLRPPLRYVIHPGALAVLAPRAAGPRPGSGGQDEVRAPP
jgi:diacylglycerol kinase family enzyme